MKSFVDSRVENLGFIPPEIMEHLKKEGFEFKTDGYAYCWQIEHNIEGENIKQSYPIENRFLRKAIYTGTWDIFIYIFTYGIGVDIDYDCGGNSTNTMFLFENSTFEEAYDKAVEFVEEYR